MKLNSYTIKAIAVILIAVTMVQTACKKESLMNQ